jgi:hypothetical protein
MKCSGVSFVDEGSGKVLKHDAAIKKALKAQLKFPIRFYEPSYQPSALSTSKQHHQTSMCLPELLPVVCCQPATYSLTFSVGTTILGQRYILSPDMEIATSYAGGARDIKSQREHYAPLGHIRQSLLCSQES